MSILVRIANRQPELSEMASAVVTAIAARIEKGKFDLAPLTAVITTLACTVLAHLQASRYDGHVVSYRATTHRLANLKALASPAATVTEFALNAEEIITSEIKCWQAMWLSEKQK